MIEARCCSTSYNAQDPPLPKQRLILPQRSMMPRMRNCDIKTCAFKCLVVDSVCSLEGLSSSSCGPHHCGLSALHVDILNNKSSAEYIWRSNWLYSTIFKSDSIPSSEQKGAPPSYGKGKVFEGGKRKDMINKECNVSGNIALLRGMVRVCWAGHLIVLTR